MKNMWNRTLQCSLLAVGMASSVVHPDALPEIDCLIEPNVTIELSSPVAGVLETISVDRSDVVRKGEVVATLIDDVEQVNVDIGEEKLSLSKTEYRRAIELYKDNVITLSEKEQAENKFRLTELELDHARAELALRRMRSPIDAVVAERYLMPGEYVDANAVLRLVQLDPLKVEIVAPVSLFGRIEKGMLARVHTEFGSYDDLVAEVVVVDSVIDAASGTFGIRLELENENNRVPGGLKCRAVFLDENQPLDSVADTRSREG